MSQGGISSPVNNNKIIKIAHQKLDATEKKYFWHLSLIKVFNKNCDKILRSPARVFEHKFIYLHFNEKNSYCVVLQWNKKIQSILSILCDDWNWTITNRSLRLLQQIIIDEMELNRQIAAKLF